MTTGNSADQVELAESKESREAQAIRLLQECQPYITAAKTGFSLPGSSAVHSALQRRVMEFLAGAGQPPLMTSES